MKLIIFYVCHVQSFNTLQILIFVSFSNSLELGWRKCSKLLSTMPIFFVNIKKNNIKHRGKMLAGLARDQTRAFRGLSASYTRVLTTSWTDGGMTIYEYKFCFMNIIKVLNFQESP